MPSLSKAIRKLRQRDGRTGEQSPTHQRDVPATTPPPSNASPATASVNETLLLQGSSNEEPPASIISHPPGTTPNSQRGTGLEECEVQHASVQPSEVANALLATSGAEPAAAQAPSSNVRNQPFDTAVKELAEDLEPEVRRAFLEAYQEITPEQTLATIRSLDERDRRTLGRRGARSLGPAIQVLNQFMGGISIGIQQNPEISSLAVGGVRLVIDLVVKFVDFYTRLSEMICDITDYLKPLAAYSLNTSDDSDLQKALIGIYSDLLKFFQQARLVFVTNDGTIRKFGTFRTFFRVQWQPFDDTFGAIKIIFEHHLRVVENSAQVQQLNVLNILSEAVRIEFSQARLERTRVQSRDEIDERLKFLGWISNENYEADFDRIIKQRHPGTGMWLVNTAKFQWWLCETSSSLLWCYGNPGAGKSVLASVALDHLTKYEFNDETTCVIFAYYNYRHPERDSPASLVGSLIKQLCTKRKVLPEKIQTFFQNTFNNAKKPTFEDMEPLLYELLESYSKVFIVVDGLDECEAPSLDRDRSTYIPGYKIRYREEILELIAQLTCRRSILAKVLVTSRRERDIQSAFNCCPMIELDAREVNSDIRIFLEDEIERRIQKRSLRLHDPNLKYVILNILGTRAEGMFLWARLQLDWICDQDGDEDIRDALSDLPRDLYETYDHILRRIDQQTPRLQMLGRKAIMWVLCTERPLTMPELQEAIAIEPGIASLKQLKSKLRDDEIILNSAGNLITVESRYPFYVRPIHASVTEYITGPRKEHIETTISKYFIDVELANCQLAISCMNYLHLDIFAAGPCTDFKDFSNRYLEDHSAQLWSYACFFFDKHIRQLQSLTPKVQKQLDAILENDDSFFAAVLQCRHSQGLKADARSHYIAPKFPANAATLLYSTALYDIISTHKPSSPWLKAFPPRHALHHAITEGLDHAVPRLAELTEDIDEEDEDGMTPLYRAAVENENFNITKCLLEHGAKVDLHSSDHGPALLAACGRADLSVFELLLKYNADVNVQSGRYNTALQYACTLRRLEVVQKLLEHKADVNLQGGHFETALQAACYHAYPPVVKLLLENKANVNQHGGPYGTALVTAAYFGYTSIVELLLEHNADVNLRSKDYGTALEVASEYRHSDIVKLLLSKGATSLSTSLSAALSRYHYMIPYSPGVEEILLEKGAQATSEGLEIAVERGSLKLCQMLLERGAEITPKAFEHVFSQRAPDILRLFIDNGAEATPEALEAASGDCWYEGCMILLERGVEITSKAHLNACGRLFQCDPHNTALIMLENGREVNVEALEEAAKWGWYDRCKILLDRGVEITPKALLNSCGLTCGNDYVVWLLLRRGAQVTEEALRIAREGRKWAPKRYMLLVKYEARQHAQDHNLNVVQETARLETAS